MSQLFYQVNQTHSSAARSKCLCVICI